MFNLSVYKLVSGDASCFMWDETIAKRGSCEVASALMKYLKLKASEGKTSVALYADNCGGQNKNQVMLAMLLHIVQVRKQFQK